MLSKDCIFEAKLGTILKLYDGPIFLEKISILGMWHPGPDWPYSLRHTYEDSIFEARIIAYLRAILGGFVGQTYTTKVATPNHHLVLPHID
jgi:hypothetical protein